MILAFLFASEFTTPAGYVHAPNEDFGNSASFQYSSSNWVQLQENGNTSLEINVGDGKQTVTGNTTDLQTLLNERAQNNDMIVSIMLLKPITPAIWSLLSTPGAKAVLNVDGETQGAIVTTFEGMDSLSAFRQTDAYKTVVAHTQEGGEQFSMKFMKDSTAS